MSFYAKQAAARVDYSIDWSGWLPDGELITDAEWSVEPSEAGGVQLSDPIEDHGRYGIHASGGLPGHLYRVTCVATTDQGRQAARSLVLRIQEQ